MLQDGTYSKTYFGCLAHSEVHVNEHQQNFYVEI